MSIKHEPLYQAWRYTLNTNQYKRQWPSFGSVNYGTYACVFIAYEFLHSILNISSDHWPKIPTDIARFLREKIQHYAYTAIDAGVNNHKDYCETSLRCIPPDKAKGPHEVYTNYVNQKGAALRIDDLRKCNADSIILPYSPENKRNVHEKVGYILGGNNHVISLIRYNNTWLLFNSLPETRGLHYTSYAMYPIYDAYILCFHDSDTIQNVLRYVTQSLWMPKDSIDIYPYF